MNKRKGYRYQGFTEWFKTRTEKHQVVIYIAAILIVVWAMNKVAQSDLHAFITG